MDFGIGQFFRDLANHWAAYVTALGIIGGVSMTLLQTVKEAKSCKGSVFR